MCPQEQQYGSILCVSCGQDRCAIKHFIKERLEFAILIATSGRLMRHSSSFEISGMIKPNRLVFYISNRTDELLLGVVLPVPQGPMKKIHMRRVERSFATQHGSSIDVVDFDEIKCILIPG